MSSCIAVASRRSRSSSVGTSSGGAATRRSSTSLSAAASDASASASTGRVGRAGRRPADRALVRGGARQDRGQRLPRVRRHVVSHPAELHAGLRSAAASAGGGRAAVDKMAAPELDGHAVAAHSGREAVAAADAVPRAAAIRVSLEAAHADHHHDVRVVGEGALEPLGGGALRNRRQIVRRAQAHGRRAVDVEAEEQRLLAALARPARDKLAAVERKRAAGEHRRRQRGEDVEPQVLLAKASKGLQQEVGEGAAVGPQRARQAVAVRGARRRRRVGRPTLKELADDDGGQLCDQRRRGVPLEADKVVRHRRRRVADDAEFRRVGRAWHLRAHAGLARPAHLNVRLGVVADGRLSGMATHA